MSHFEKLRLAETDANRVRKVNIIVDALNDTTESETVLEHEAAENPHPQYTTEAEAAAAAPVQSVNGLEGDVVLHTETPGAATEVEIVATESSGVVLKTVLTLDDYEVAMTDATTAGSHGSVQLYDFPAGNIVFLGATCDLTVTAGVGGITDTAAVVGSVGTATVGTDDATLTTTEADLIPSTAATLTDGAGVMKGKTVTAGMVVFDGTGTAKDAWLNFAVPDAGSTANDTLTVAGTVTLVWLNLGDV